MKLQKIFCTLVFIIIGCFSQINGQNNKWIPYDIKKISNGNDFTPGEIIIDSTNEIITGWKNSEATLFFNGTELNDIMNNNVDGTFSAVEIMDASGDYLVLVGRVNASQNLDIQFRVIVMNIKTLEIISSLTFRNLTPGATVDSILMVDENYYLTMGGINSASWTETIYGTGNSVDNGLPFNKSEAMLRIDLNSQEIKSWVTLENELFAKKSLFDIEDIYVYSVVFPVGSDKFELRRFNKESLNSNTVTEIERSGISSSLPQITKYGEINGKKYVATSNGHVPVIIDFETEEVTVAIPQIVDGSPYVNGNQADGQQFNQDIFYLDDAIIYLKRGMSTNPEASGWITVLDPKTGFRNLHSRIKIKDENGNLIARQNIIGSYMENNTLVTVNYFRGSGQAFIEDVQIADGSQSSEQKILYKLSINIDTQEVENYGLIHNSPNASNIAYSNFGNVEFQGVQDISNVNVLRTLKEKSVFIYPNDNTFEDFSSNQVVSIASDSSNTIEANVVNAYLETATTNLSINQLTKLGITISPNPTSDIIFITDQNHQHKKAVLTNILGQEVLLKEVSTNQISLKSLHNGIYFLKLYSENKYLGCKKIIKN